MCKYLYIKIMSFLYSGEGFLDYLHEFSNDTSYKRKPLHWIYKIVALYKNHKHNKDIW